MREKLVSVIQAAYDEAIPGFAAEVEEELAAAEAEALAAIDQSWLDESERTSVMKPRHLALGLLPRHQDANWEQDATVYFARDGAPGDENAGPGWDDPSEATCARPSEPPRLMAAAQAPAPADVAIEPTSSHWEEPNTEHFTRVDAAPEPEPDGLLELARTLEPNKAERSLELWDDLEGSGERSSANATAQPCTSEEDPGWDQPLDSAELVAFQTESSPRRTSALPGRRQTLPAQTAAATPAQTSRRPGSTTVRGRAAVSRDSRTPPSPPTRASQPRVAGTPQARSLAAPASPANATRMSRSSAARRSVPAPLFVPAADRGERSRHETPELSAGIEASLVRSMRPGRSVWGTSAWLALPLCALLGGYALWANRSQPRAPLESSTAAAIAPVVPAAGFSIASTPAGAQIVVDGKALAITTPAIVGELLPGLHSVELRLAGYLSSNMPAQLEPGQTLMLPSVELRPIAAAPAELAPAEASSAAPRKLNARERRAARRASARRVQADRAEQSEGYARRILTPNLDSETADSSSVENLATEGGTLQINSRPWARVFVDGRFIGHTPQRAIKLSPGTHTIRLVNDPLSMSKTLEVNIPAGETVTRVETLDEDTETSSN